MILDNQETFGLKKIYSKVSAENADDLIFRNHALFELGSLYLEKCDFPNAMDCLEKVKTEALQFHLYDNYFRSMSMLLRIHSERLDFDKHESLMREVLQVGASLSGYQRYLPKFYYNQAVAAMYKREFNEARTLFIKSEQLAAAVLTDPSLNQKDKDDLQKDRLSARYGVAVIFRDEKLSKEALELAALVHKDILETLDGDVTDQLQLHDLQASLLILEGQCYRDFGQYSKSLDKYWEAHGILKAHRNWSFYYYVLLGLGQVYLAMENKERAQIFFDLIADAIGDLELNALKRALERSSQQQMESASNKLWIDRERKVILEQTLGEVHFERRFVLLEILYLLASEPGKVFTKEDLVDRIWRESYNPMVHDSKVYTSISRLRKLIEPDFKRPIYILNERDGYSFNPAIQLEEVSPRLRKNNTMEHLPLRRELAVREGLGL